ncbi:MAG: MogA/MoaB family molybdenum cofactor biosynthesis protein [Mycobacteriales bacterium]
MTTPLPGLPAGARARVVTVSDRSSRGERADTSGPLLAGLLAELGLVVDDVVVVPDDVPAVQEALRDAAAAAYDLVVTTGGTGLSPRDVTPEATRPLLEREAPGLAEALRRQGVDAVPTAILSRGVAGTIGPSLVVNLPGSTGGVRDGVAVLAPVLAHALAQLRGGGDHR